MLTIVNNVDHVVHIDNVGKGDKVDKLILLTTKILAMFIILTTLTVLSMLTMLTILTKLTLLLFIILKTISLESTNTFLLQVRDQREWVFDVREVKSEKEKLSLFFEKCKVKKNAFTLFREVQSEKKCFHSFSRSAK